MTAGKTGCQKDLYRPRKGLVNWHTCKANTTCQALLHRQQRLVRRVNWELFFNAAALLNFLRSLLVSESLLRRSSDRLRISGPSSGMRHTRHVTGMARDTCFRLWWVAAGAPATGCGLADRLAERGTPDTWPGVADSCCIPRDPAGTARSDRTFWKRQMTIKFFYYSRYYTCYFSAKPQSTFEKSTTRKIHLVLVKITAYKWSLSEMSLNNSCVR
jgi:hypothetical protein